MEIELAGRWMMNDQPILIFDTVVAAISDVFRTLGTFSGWAKSLRAFELRRA